MSYCSWIYYVMVIVLLVIYYVIPKQFRWFVLLLGSITFYIQVINSIKQIVLFGLSILISFFAGLLLQKVRSNENIRIKRTILFVGIILSVFPLLLNRTVDFIFGSLIHITRVSWIVPVGLSFYTLQLIAYLIDVYKGEIDAQVNLLKYGLFVSFFPQIIQGPIPRYKQLKKELFEGNNYKTENIMSGIQLIIWAFFLKYMIADKAATIVNEVFDNYHAYSGVYIWIAAFLYSIQLYTDFLSCTTMSQGVAEMFGIHLVNNFNHPYFSASVKEFWHRWHMSLSFWLRDYIYIPLGGNKNGRFLKHINLIITFLVSGLWHGGSWKYVIWGLLHAFYQIVGEVKQEISSRYFLNKSLLLDKKLLLTLHRIETFIIVMIAWIIFRAESFKASLDIIVSMFTNFNIWVLFNDSLFELGLNWKECIVLMISIVILGEVSHLQEKGVKLRNYFSKQNTVIRWLVYLIAIWTIWIFGSYGFGFDAQDFIYGGF